MIRPLVLALALACSPVQAQKPFSQSWNTTDMGTWKPSDSMYAGAMVSIFSNIYCDQTGAKWYWRILIPMIMSLGYEVYRWAEGKQPLALSGVYAGIGAIPVTFCFTIRF